MNCCDEYGDCRQGRDCPVRRQAAQQAERSEPHTPTGPLASEPDGASVALALALAATLVVWLLAVVVAPFLAGWWHP